MFGSNNNNANKPFSFSLTSTPAANTATNPQAGQAAAPFSFSSRYRNMFSRYLFE